MYIQEAVKEALKTNGVIYRKSVQREDSVIFAVIKPTNSYETCQLIVCGEYKRSARSWNPTANDLAADDWECSQDEF